MRQGGRTVLVVNARARDGGDFERAREALAAGGVELAAAHAVEDPAELGDRIRDELSNGARRVVVGGGDGTVSAAAGLLAWKGVALGVLPLGTANDFARTLRIPADLERAARIVARGRTRDVDLGLVGTRAFLNAASVGVSSELTRRLDDDLKKRAGKLAYPVAGAAAATAPPFRARLLVGGRAHEVDALQIVIGNGRYHGGGRLIAPRARVDDQRLDVYVLEARSDAADARGHERLWDVARLARYALMLLRGRHLDHPAVFHVRTDRVVLETDPPMEIDADGELAGETPAELRVVPRALRVLAP